MFGSLSQFWLEYVLVGDASGLSADDIVNIAVRHNIKHGVTRFSKSKITELSKANLFVSTSPIIGHFGGAPAFQKRVDEAYAEYEQTRDELISNGVAPDVIDTACIRYEAGDEFRQWLKTNIETLQKLSVDNEKSKYVLTIMRKGFDLLDESYFDIQMEDFMKYLKKLGIQSEEEIRFIFTVVPRVNVDEILDQSDK